MAQATAVQTTNQIAGKRNDVEKVAKVTGLPRAEIEKYSREFISELIVMKGISS